MDPALSAVASSVSQAALLGSVGDGAGCSYQCVSSLAAEGGDRRRALAQAEPRTPPTCLARHCSPQPDGAALRRVRRTLLIAIITGFLTYYITWAMGDLAQHFVFAMRRDLFAHLQRLSLRFHDHQRTGDLTTRLTSDTQAIQEMIANGITVLGTNGCLLARMLVVR